MKGLLTPAMTVIFLLFSFNRLQSQQLPALHAGNQLKSTQEDIEKLDSTLIELWEESTGSFYGWHRVVYNYDMAGNTILTMVYVRYTSVDQWIVDVKMEDAYNAAGNRILHMQSKWDENKNNWINEIKFEDSWDEKGNITRDIFSEMDTATNEWFYISKTEYAYDAGSNPMQRIYYYWDRVAGQFMLGNRTEYTYDESGNNSLLSLYGWQPDISQWVIANKSEFTWDSNNNLTSQTDKYLDNDKWFINGKQEFTYNELGQKSLFIWIFYDLETHTPYAGTKIAYYYDAAGNIILSNTYRLDITSGEWKAYSKYEIVYDAGGRVTLNTFYSWDPGKSDWTGFEKNEYTYNENGNITLHVLYNWDINTSNWKSGSRQYYYYSVHSFVPVNLISAGSVSVYPNPASDYIVFEMGDESASAIVELFNSQGRQVLVRRLTAREPVQVGNLASGMYMYRVMNRGKIYQGKIVLNQ